MTDGHGAICIHVRVEDGETVVSLVPAGPTAKQDPIAGDMTTESGATPEAMRAAVHQLIDTLFDDPGGFGLSKLVVAIPKGTPA